MKISQKAWSKKVNYLRRCMRAYLAFHGLKEGSGQPPKNAVLVSLCEAQLRLPSDGPTRERMLRVGEHIIKEMPTYRKFAEEEKASRVKENKQRRRDRKAFYDTDQWKRVRYQALQANDGRCECCGRAKTDGVVLHVDHIKPRSKYPGLELDLANLQVLCGECNLGKSAWDETDWREPRLAVLMGERVG